jgi:hypothetical protein
MAGCTLALTVAACGGGGDGAAQVDAGAVQQLRAAAVCGYQHVYVSIDQVRLRRKVGASGKWTDVAVAPSRRIDLMASGGGLLEALGVAPLTPGQYTEVRLHTIDAAAGTELAHAVQLADGSQAPLKVSGNLMLAVDFVVPEGRQGDVVLQGFDPCVAITTSGKPVKYRLAQDHSATLLTLPPPTETRLPEGTTLPVVGGGYVLMRLQSPNVWTLQRFNAQGAPGAVTTVAPAMGSSDSNPTILPLTGGGYAAMWLRLVRSDRFGSLYDVVTQGFSSTGAALAPPQTVGQTAPFHFASSPRPIAFPEMAALTGGGYAVVWLLPESSIVSVYARRLNADGTPAGAAQQATTNGGGDLGIVGLSTGGYLVNWMDGPVTGRFGRIYTAADVPLGAGQAAGPVRSLNRGHLAALADGGAVMTWLGDAAPFPFYLHVVQFAPNGTPRVINPVTDGSSEPSIGETGYPVVGLPQGGYVLAWFAAGEVHARRFAADGTPLGNETRINLVTTSVQGPLAVTTLANGGFLVTWSGVGSDGVRANYGREFKANGLIASS